MYRKLKDIAEKKERQTAAYILHGRAVPGYQGFTGRWSGHSGKWTKRQLHKARRRAFKQHPRKSLLRLESECNWKGW